MNDRQGLAVVLLLALIVRVAWVLAVHPEPSAGDPFAFHASAVGIAEGIGYLKPIDGTYDNLEFAGPTAFYSPGYPYFLAGVYKLLGGDPLIARLANAVLGAAIVLPVYLLARRFGRGGLTALASVALMPSLIFLTAPVVSETLFFLVFAWAAFTLLTLKDRFDIRLAIVAGVLVGVAVLVRPQGVLLYTLVLLLFPNVRALGLVCAVSLIVLSPWVIRNATVMDTATLTTSTGYNLRIGHAPYSTGSYIVPQDLAADSAGMPNREAEVFNDREGRTRSLDYAFTHPANEADLAAKKMFHLWRPATDAPIQANLTGNTLGLLKAVVIVTEIAFGILVLYGAIRSGYIGIPLVLVGAWCVLHILTFSHPRYHLPLIPLFAPLAGYAMASLLEQLRLRRSVERPAPVAVE